jgi:hypothetical protein
MVSRIDRHRSMVLGGRDVYSSAEMRQLIARWSPSSVGKTTRYLGLPDGDVSVDPESTLCATGLLPTGSLTIDVEAFFAIPEPDTSPPTVYPVGDPAPDDADLGDSNAALVSAGPELRRVIHRQLVAHLLAEGVPVAQLDFGRATPRGPILEAHDGTLTELEGVRAIGEDGDMVYSGPMCVLRDELADGLWVFAGDSLPEFIWDQLDMGVRRRLMGDGRWSNDPRVLEWSRRVTGVPET